MFVSALVHFDPFSDQHVPNPMLQNPRETGAINSTDLASAKATLPKPEESMPQLVRSVGAPTGQGVMAGDARKTADTTAGLRREQEPRPHVNDNATDPRLEAEQTAKFESIRAKLHEAPYTRAYTVHDLNKDIATLSKNMSDQLIIEATQMLNDKTLDRTQFLQLQTQQ